MFNISKGCFKKAVVKIILVIVIITLVVPVFAMEENKTYNFSGGEGTKKSPFLISNTEDLFTLSEAFSTNNNIRDAHFKLVSDIDIGEREWQPIGSQFVGFSGVFDGNGKKIIIRNMGDGNNLGLFGQTDSQSTIKNLMVKGIVNKKINSLEVINFGLLAAKAEGTIENCITEGSIVLSIDSTEDINVGGIIGFGRGNLSNLKNGASLKVVGSGKKYISIGGVIGSSRDNISSVSNTTNTGAIESNIEGKIRVGGIVGHFGFGPKLYNALNQGKISAIAKNVVDNFAAIGGITGEIRGSNMDRALNKGNIYISFLGNSNNEEIIAGGITGIGENTKISNVGNEGTVEGREAKILYVTGITGNGGREVSIKNAYTKGNIYGISSLKKADIYAEGLTGGVVTADNFYVSGRVRLKAGNLKEIDGDYITNIRPGENTKSFNYGYWPSGVLPFPLLQKEQATTSSFNTSTGKLSRNVNIGGKSYNTITQALNAWIDTQKGDYLRWVGKNTPGFDWTFGYKAPEYMSYKNGREGKWLNTSDWAVEWMDKADKLDIIPDVLLDVDMTKGITRKEFSALVINLYEYLSKEKLIVESNSPFIDVDDENVTKAYELGIVAGTGNGLFTPNVILTREQASTMLTRVYQKNYGESLDIYGVAKFSDDALISSWAKESVYFMAKENIISGIGNNIFAPKYKTGENESYGRATREQAFKIAVAMIEKFVQ